MGSVVKGGSATVIGCCSIVMGAGVAHHGVQAEIPHLVVPSPGDGALKPLLAEPCGGISAVVGMRLA